MPRFSSALVLLVAVLSACSDIDSEDVLTSGVSPSYTLEARDGKTSVTAQLRAGNGSLTFLELRGDDKLLATHDGEEKELSKRTDIDFNAPSYATSFDTAEPGAEIVIAFQRSVDDGAPASSVKLPSAVEIAAPATDAELSRASDDLVVEIDAAAAEGETTTAKLEGSCIEPASKTFDGAATRVRFDSGSIASRKNEDGEPIDDDCELTLTVSRSRDGVLDEAFTEGGSFVAQQTRVRKLVSKP